MVKTSTLAIILAALIISVVFTAEADGAGLVKRAISTAGRWQPADLPTPTVLSNTTNTYTAGQKQIFQSSASTAAIKIVTTSDPSSVVQGDIWFSVSDLKWRGSSATQTAERTENKGIASGYTPLNSNSLIPSRFLGSGTNSSSNFLRGDNTWSSTPEVTTNKGIASGYTPLNSAELIPSRFLGSGTNSSSNFLRGDNSWAVPPDGGYTKLNSLGGGNSTIISANTTLSSTQATFKNMVGTPKNVTISNSTIIHFNLGNDVVMTSGSLQNVTKGLIVQGLSTKIRNTTTTYTVTSTDDTIFVNPMTRTAYTITLPAASTVQGKIISFFYTSQLGVPVTIDGNGNDLIYQSQNLNMTDFRENIVLQSTGTNWIILNQPVASGKSIDGVLLLEDEFISGGTTTGVIGSLGWVITTSTDTQRVAIANHPGIAGLASAAGSSTVPSIGRMTLGSATVALA